MDKKLKTILMVVAAVVVIVALFIPYTEKEPEPIKLTSFSCSEASENQENDTNLNKISCQQYQDLTQDDKESLILIARPTCGACTSFIPVLEEVVDEYGITVNYFNTDALSEEEISAFYNSSTLYKSNSFGTPTLLIVKGNNILNYKIGAMNKENTIKWLKKVNVINE